MKYFRFLFSGALMGILLIIFGAAVGYATFVENDHDATTARMLVYNAWWFEAVLALMVLNFAGMIFTKRLYIKGKLNILIIHVSLIIIIIGAGVTRYVGYEGVMHIRNGETSNKIRSSETFIDISLEKEGSEVKRLFEKVILSPSRENTFHSSTNIEGESFKVSLIRYMPKAARKLVSVNNGRKYISMIIGSPDGRRDIILEEGESKEVAGVNISFGENQKGDQYLSIISRGDSLYLKSSQSVEETSMGASEGELIAVNDYTPISLMGIYKLETISFVVNDFIESGIYQYQPVTDEAQNGVGVALMEFNGEQVYVKEDVFEEFLVDGLNTKVYLGSMNYTLPFSLQLKRFELERYPGSNSPSSFASDVVVIDEENNNRFEYKIYMNNVLNYGGYRFFQSSYDSDEGGTILSVNHDFLGTTITYIGYALLFASLIFSLFTKTRIHMITLQINDIHAQRKKMGISAVVALMLLFSTQNVIAQELTGIQEIDKDHAASFGRLITQSQEGRVEPVNTLSNKVVVKINKKASYKGLTADQVILGIISNPVAWQNEPVIKITDEAIGSILEINSEYASFMDFIFPDGKYKLRDHVNRAYAKKPALRSTFDKEVIYVDERVNVLYQSLNLFYLKIFPVPDDPDNKWLNPTDFHNLKGHGTAEGDLFENYINALEDALATGDYTAADNALVKIKEFQKQWGASIIPSEAKINMEIFYNNVNIFKTLFPIYFVLGILLVGIFFLGVFNPSWNFRVLKIALTSILAIAFLAQTIGLGLRWYVSGHAPWSNGYESMIYIAWATVLAGFLFMKKSQASLGVTAILAGITLLTAHMSWLNPEITNLVPVLKSYWLTIHVATITASYGFLALGCMMGFLNLLLMIFRNNNNKLRVNLTLQELTLIIEFSLSIGLILLIIGNFLGGVWANESWGRYWGWDPKESWTLVTVIFYSFVLHMRLIPNLRSTFTFNFLSLIGFGCVLMTYFGVNYYLSGLHSYANGDPVPVPSFVYYTLLIILAVSVLAAYNEFKMEKSNQAPAVSTP